ncbi:hypothetical protein [Amycolatopsis australiensis]|uniref:Uncharacterized protein n=1 Tax=Amycolatopsis australiensis TaxID=546364 RepID=A0A1K1QRE9_9PSEU|nr:hypothetical protein [Amycolatopsis australiensis]SFW62503.1 hypothetical protein SAMN04489730_2140 [Amycolatopsis australiensis]
MDGENEPSAPAGASQAQAELVLRDELGQAWQHYRHLEVLRGQYLTFAFTVTFALAAIGIPATPKLSSSPSLLLLTASLTLFYALFITSYYANVRKIRFLLMHYQRVMMGLRKHFLTVPGFEPHLAALELMSSIHPVIRHWAFRIQTISEAVFVFLLALATVIEAVTTVAVARHGVWWQILLMAAIDGVAVLLSGSVVGFAVLLRRDPHSDQGPISAR